MNENETEYKNNSSFVELEKSRKKEKLKYENLMSLLEQLIEEQKKTNNYLENIEELFKNNNKNNKV